MAHAAESRVVDARDAAVAGVRRVFAQEGGSRALHGFTDAAAAAGGAVSATRAGVALCAQLS
jgi:hypothetical protein